MVRRKRWSGPVLLGVLLAVPGACSDDGGESGGPPLSGYGDEGEPCYPNETCNDGLRCEDAHCVTDVSDGGESSVGGTGAVAQTAGQPGGAGEAPTASGGTLGSSGNGGAEASGGAMSGGAGPNLPRNYRPMPNSVSSGLPNPASYDTSEPGIVLDELTSLMWQRVLDVNKPSTPAPAVSHCGQLITGGFTDWRLPTRLELASIVDHHAEAPPRIDQSAFPNTPLGLTWTATVRPDAPPDYWKVEFELGYVTYLYNAEPSPIRCVRGEPWAPDFVVGSGELDGTVADRTTGLTWEQGSSPSLHDWPAAQSYCTTLELAGLSWRLPSIKELLLLVDESKVEAQFADERFPHDPSLTDINLAYWSSTPVAGIGTSAWHLRFYAGVPSIHTSNNEKRVRCVSP